ncbi:MAG TPA: asparagine synthase-related protein, partial [Thermoanaerobaculia bacterium]
GHGGDELFAGYITFAEDALRHRIRRLRLLGAWSAARAAARTRNPVLGHSGVSALRGLAGALYHSVIPPKTPRKSFLSTMFEIDLFPEPGEQQFAAAIPGLSPLKRALYGAFHSRVLPTILRVSDRSTMAYSVESRSPFLDHRIVSYAFSLPDDDLIGAGWTKRILREAMSPLLPESIVWRARKLPFIVPQPEWFRQPAVLDAMRQALHDGTIARAPGLNRETFAAMLMRGAQHGFGWRDSTLMWTAYSYAIWSELFRVGNVRARSVTAASI